MERGLWGFPNPSGNPLLFFACLFETLREKRRIRIAGAGRPKAAPAKRYVSPNTDMARNELLRPLTGERSRGDETPQGTLACLVA